MSFSVENAGGIPSGVPASFFCALFLVDFYVWSQDFRIVLIPLLVPQRGPEMKQLPDLQRVACVGADRDRRATLKCSVVANIYKTMA